MATKWYESRTNQAALIGAAALIIVTIVGGLFNLASRPSYPTIEVKDLSPGGEQVLARLALSPARQLVDSASFAELAQRDLLWNDSLGVAIRKPAGFEWGVASSDTLDDVSRDDLLLLKFYSGMARRGFGENAFRSTTRFFGVRLDKPVLLTVTVDTRLDGAEVGRNPFMQADYFIGFMKMTFGPTLDGLDLDSLSFYQRDAIASLDSVAHTYLPSVRRIFNGVFVARVTTSDLKDPFLDGLISQPLLDRVARVVGISTGAPALLVLDRDRQTLIFSEVARIERALVEGVVTPNITLNRAGYAIQRKDAVYVVMLQYTSNQPKEVLDELERLLASVRLRAEPA